MRTPFPTSCPNCNGTDIEGVADPVFGCVTCGCRWDEKARKAAPRPTKAFYNRDVYCLYLATTWKGPDGCERTMSVDGLPNEDVAREFLKYMGWSDIPFRVTP